MFSDIFKLATNVGGYIVDFFDGEDSDDPNIMFDEFDTGGSEGSSFLNFVSKGASMYLQSRADKDKSFQSVQRDLRPNIQRYRGRAGSGALSSPVFRLGYRNPTVQNAMRNLAVRVNREPSMQRLTAQYTVRPNKPRRAVGMTAMTSVTKKTPTVARAKETKVTS